MSFVAEYKEDLIQAINHLELDKVDQAVQWFREAQQNGRHIFTCGNGGSAASASHVVCDILKGASYGREKRYKILALTDSLSTLTAYSNDVGFEHVFVEQLKNFAGPGDVLLCISGSGNSPNVIRAIEYAKKIGCKTIAMTGRDGGQLGPLADLNIQVPIQHMGRIEDAHMIACHMIAYSLMQ
jgi:D-sedoheptulose 7-phosphate isomerase